MGFKLEKQEGENMLKLTIFLLAIFFTMSLAGASVDADDYIIVEFEEGEPVPTELVLIGNGLYKAELEGPAGPMCMTVYIDREKISTWNTSGFYDVCYDCNPKYVFEYDANEDSLSITKYPCSCEKTFNTSSSTATTTKQISVSTEPEGEELCTYEGEETCDEEVCDEEVGKEEEEEEEILVPLRETGVPLIGGIIGAILLLIGFIIKKRD